MSFVYTVSANGGAAVRKKKEQALKENAILRCEVCDFVFKDKYGVLGEGFIECHYRTPVSKMQMDHKTTTNDLALVCADCHRMLHRGGELLTIEHLRQIVVSHKTSK